MAAQYPTDTYSTNPVRPASERQWPTMDDWQSANQYGQFPQPRQAPRYGTAPSTGGTTPTYPSTQPYQVGNQNPNAAPTPNARPGSPVQPGTGMGYGFSWSPPAWLSNQDQAGWGSDAMAKALQNYGLLQPWVQTQQNAYQWGNEFNENQRRWDQQFGWQQLSDQFGMNLSAQQQALADWVARQNAAQWEKQFGLDTEMGRGNLALGNRELDIRDQYQQGQLGLGQRTLESEDWYRRAQANQAQQANTIDQMWKSGQLSNQQRELALAELTQGQNEAFRRAQLAQEAALTRENYANQMRLASMAAFGRAQAPNARWLRSW
jgi:hypothetical protein